MIDSTRLDILSLLQEASILAPDLRFGQMIANLAFLASGPWDETLWDLEDERLAIALREHVADLKERQPVAA